MDAPALAHACHHAFDALDAFVVRLRPLADRATVDAIRSTALAVTANALGERDWLGAMVAAAAFGVADPADAALARTAATLPLTLVEVRDRGRWVPVCARSAHSLGSRIGQPLAEGLTDLAVGLEEGEPIHVATLEALQGGAGELAFVAEVHDADGPAPARARLTFGEPWAWDRPDTATEARNLPPAAFAEFASAIGAALDMMGGPAPDASPDTTPAPEG